MANDDAIPPLDNMDSDMSDDGIAPNEENTGPLDLSPDKDGGVIKEIIKKGKGL